MRHFVLILFLLSICAVFETPEDYEWMGGEMRLSEYRADHMPAEIIPGSVENRFFEAGDVISL